MFPLTASRVAGALMTALVVGCGSIAAQGTDAEGLADHGPVACSLTLDQTGRGLVIEGLVEARQSVSGEYRLHVSGRGANLNQGGPFRLGAGDTETLGRITMNAPAASLDTELTLTIDGRSYSCPAG